MTIETRLNRQIANGVHAAKVETLVPPPFVFPDGTTFKASSDTQRKILETIFKAKEVYLNAKKTDPNVKEADYILSKPELCRRVYPGVPFRVASNDLTRASAALRHEMYEQAVPWQLIPVTPKLGKPSTYDLVKVKEQPKKIGVSQPIPVESKNGELITKPPPPTQSDTDVKKEEGQVGNERKYTIPDLANGLQITPGWMQSIIQAKYSRLGEYRIGLDDRKRRYYSAEEYETITGHKPGGSLPTKARPHRKGKNARNLTTEEKARKKTEQIRQEERRTARINQAKQHEQISVDFTNAILKSLATKPLKTLGKDLKAFLKTHSSHKTEPFIEEFIKQYTVEQILTFVAPSFIKTLNELLNGSDGAQTDSIESMRRISKAREAQIVIKKYKGIEKLTMAVAKHFSIPVTA